MSLCTENVHLGVKMEVYDDDDDEVLEEDVYGDLLCDNCDMPAARKVSGTAGHSADIHPCPWCRCIMLDVNRPAGYNIDGKHPHCGYFMSAHLFCFSEFVLRDDFDMLKQKFYHKDAPTQRRNNILANHGVRFAALDYIPGWRPSQQTALDFMHAIFLSTYTLSYSLGAYSNTYNHQASLLSSSQQSCFQHICFLVREALIPQNNGSKTL